MLIGKGLLDGRSRHTLRGSFSLTRQSNGVLFETSDNFFFDGSPAPGFAFSRGEPIDKDDPKVRAIAAETDFLRIADKVMPVNGKQAGVIPSSIDIDNFDTVFLWCYEIPFILGVGPIERV